MIKIIYIFHSSFLVSTPDANIIFDYWQDPDNRLLTLLDKEKPLYVVVSHHHKDHFSTDIFKWNTIFPYIRYVLSEDASRMSRYVFSPTSTHRGPRVDAGKLSILRPGEEFFDGKVKINAFGSTDIGNSYLVEAEGIKIFHAGDLNAWIWKDESTEEEVAQAIEQFNRHIGLIRKHLEENSGEKPASERPCIDIAFFPVDSRIGSEYWTGAKIFLENFNVGKFFPMHFGLGSAEEQLRHRLDSACFELYAPQNSSTEFIGPLQPYGAVAFSPNKKR